MNTMLHKFKDHTYLSISQEESSDVQGLNLIGLIYNRSMSLYQCTDIQQLYKALAFKKVMIVEFWNLWTEKLFKLF